jgi:hypothetical protein
LIHLRRASGLAAGGRVAGERTGRVGTVAIASAGRCTTTRTTGCRDALTRSRSCRAGLALPSACAVAAHAIDAVPVCALCIPRAGLAVGQRRSAGAARAAVETGGTGGCRTTGGAASVVAATQIARTGIGRRRRAAPGAIADRLGREIARRTARWGADGRAAGIGTRAAIRAIALGRALPGAAARGTWAHRCSLDGRTFSNRARRRTRLALPVALAVAANAIDTVTGRALGAHRAAHAIVQRLCARTRGVAVEACAA